VLRTAPYTTYDPRIGFCSDSNAGAVLRAYPCVGITVERLAGAGIAEDGQRSVITLVRV
jgi:hypothetical protein